MRTLQGATAEERLAARWFPVGAMAIKHPQGFGVAYVAPYQGKGDSQYQVVAYRGTARKNGFYL